MTATAKTASVNLSVVFEFDSDGTRVRNVLIGGAFTAPVIETWEGEVINGAAPATPDEAELALDVARRIDDVLAVAMVEF